MDNKETNRPKQAKTSASTPKAKPSPEAVELTPVNKYAPKARVRPTIGKDQIGGPKQQVTPRFNSVRTVLH